MIKDDPQSHQAILHFGRQSPSSPKEQENNQEKTMKKVRSLPRQLNESSDLLKKSSSCVTLNEAFNQSLISRIRGVSRRNTEGIQIKKMSGNVAASSSKLTKSKHNIQNIKEQIGKTKLYGKETPINQQKTTDNILLELQATIQKEKIRNQELQARIEKYQCEIFIFKQQIEQLTEEIQEKDKALRQMESYSKEKEQQLWVEYSSILSNHQNLQLKYHQLCEEIEDKNQIIEHFYYKSTSQNFSISRAFQQRVITVPSHDKIALLKINGELASLKKHIISLQKAHEQNMNELRRQKENELQQMRKKFIRNLSHYKEIIIKFTTKASDSKHRQSLLESTFTQNSFNQQV